MTQNIFLNINIIVNKGIKYLLKNSTVDTYYMNISGKQVRGTYNSNNIILILIYLNFVHQLYLLINHNKC